MGTPEVIIVGAGAAGVGAALELAARGIPFLILEAADRVGGRAYTDRTSLPVPWDHGCHWFHSADVNPLVAWADRLGADYRREEWKDHFMIHSSGGWLAPSAVAEARASLMAAHAAIDAAAGRGADLAVAEVIPDAGRWDRAVRYILALLASEDPEMVSAAGYADYEDTRVNWPVVSGLGDLVERMAAGLPVRLGTPVTRVGERPGGVRVATAEGAIEAGAAIVTVSTNVLRAGAIRFGAGPARELMDLVEDVPCGIYEKVAVALRRDPIGDPGKAFCMVDLGDGASPLDFQIARTARPVLIAHMAGDLARGVAGAGPAAMAAFAMERLVAAFGAEIRREVVAVGTTGWHANPWVRGGYSYARPGWAARRHAMIGADTGRIAFAGEAFSRRWQATAHGAYQSGRDVAARVADRLG